MGPLYREFEPGMDMLLSLDEPGQNHSDDDGSGDDEGSTSNGGSSGELLAWCMRVEPF